MPRTIGEHGLYCPDPQNYGAYALYMQDLGTRIDEQLAGQQAMLDAFLNQPTMIVTSSVVVAMAAGTQFTTDLYDTVVFNNTSFMTYDFTLNRLHIGSPAGAPVTVPYPRGSYTFGAYSRFTTAGALTAGSSRLLVVAIDDDSLPEPNSVLDGVDHVIDMVGSTVSYGLNVMDNFVLNRTSGVSIEVIAQHNNAASGVNLNTDAFLWVTYNGPTDIIEVA